MNRSFPLRLGATTLLLCTISHVALAQESPADEGFALDPIYVLMAKVRAGATRYEFSPRAVSVAPAADAGALLSSTPGISASRMGGHGVDIVIRGQQGNQLNIIDAGTFTYGGCPNRMDPPTSTAALSRADRVIVERGYASVTNGPGGSGGTVRFEREAPDFVVGKRFSGSFALGATTNSDTLDLSGSLAADLGNGFYVEASADERHAGNYEDGDGRTERSAYDQSAQGLTFGYRNGTTELAFDIEHDLAEDVLFAGAGMDSPSSENWIYRLRGGMDLDAGALKRIEGNLYFSGVEHVMDNYSLRPNMGMLARVPTTSDTRGGKIEGTFQLGSTVARVGIDHQSNDRLAILYSGMAMQRPLIDAADPSTARFLMWPDVGIAQTGLYLETETPLSAKTKLKGGLRYDHVRATAGAANGLAGFPALMATPNMLYTAYYGTTFDTARTEDNIGGLLRLEHEVAPGTTVFAGLSRSVRTADANERAMARTNWVGNPDIAPEKHHQFDLGVEMAQADWDLAATAYVDQVEDYILRDQFSVAGVTTYRNVSARLSGVELSGNWRQGGWQLTGDLTYTYGQNRTDDRPLAQIPPLMGRLSASYGVDAWRGGARVNFAAGQDRIDPARDPGVTPGYATLDLFGSYALSDKAVLLAGVDNVLDKTYANHLSRANAFDTTVTRVMEPGRTLYVKLDMQF
ncbi:MAG: TonB-dependent receptor domain-containing protein [Tabrizicola sp.]